MAFKGNLSTDNSISGALSGDGSLSGNLGGEDSISGGLSSEGSMSGEVQAEGSLSGTVSGGTLSGTLSKGGSGVSDVIVDGESVVSEGIATIPAASGSELGVVKVNAGNGLTYDRNTISMNVASTTQSGAMSAADKTKLNSISPNAEVNQNAFSNVRINTTIIQADTKTDTLRLYAGNNITLLPNAYDDSITISANGIEYAQGSGIRFAKKTGSPTVISASLGGELDATDNSATLTLTDPTDTSLQVANIQFPAASNSCAGLMTASDKAKLSGIASGAQANVLEGIQKNGTNIPIANKIANIEVPTKTSELTNDSDFITSADIPEVAVPSTTTPLMDGTAEVGTEKKFARGDHRHPTDTSRAPLASPALTGIPTAPTASAATDTTQIATTAFVHDVVETMGGGISDVTINGTSVVTDNVAEIPLASTSANGAMSASDKTKLNGIDANAEENQNAFSNVKVGSTTIAADSKTDTLEFVAGSNVTLTPDATNDKLTIEATDTTYSDATVTTHGLMSANDKAKLDGIESGAQVNRTYTAVTGKPTGNLTPDFGDTITVSQVSQDATGQVSVTDRTVEIPDTVATPSSNGLMSSADKTKLNGIDDHAEVNVIEAIKVNGTSQTVTSKAVDIAVPTKISDLTNDSDFVEDASYVHTDNNYTSTEKNKLAGIASGATANTGTVTSVGVTAGSGMSVSGSPVTTSGNITVGHSNSVTPQPTQAVYPITIDEQGHVGSYGSAAVIPTATSDLTNDSNYVSADASGNITATGDVTDGSGNVLSDKADTSDLSALIQSKVFLANYTFKNTTANAWQYTGKSFTIPDGYAAICYVLSNYASGACKGLGLSVASTLPAAGAPELHQDTNSTHLNRTCAFYVPAGTYYVFSKRAAVSSSNNTYNVQGIQIKL